MIWIPVHSVCVGDIFIRHDGEAARVVSIEPNTRVLKIRKCIWETATPTGYAPIDPVRYEISTVDETNRVIVEVEIFGRDSEWRSYGVMNLRRDDVVLVVQ